MDFWIVSFVLFWVRGRIEQMEGITYVGKRGGRVLPFAQRVLDKGDFYMCSRLC